MMSIEKLKSLAATVRNAVAGPAGPPSANITNLTADIAAAVKAAERACRKTQEGGGCNMDSAWICLPYGHEADIKRAAEAAGVCVFAKDTLADDEKSRRKLVSTKRTRFYAHSRVRAHAQNGLRVYVLGHPCGETADERSGFKNTAQAKAIAKTLSALGWETEVHYVAD